MIRHAQRSTPGSRPMNRASRGGDIVLAHGGGGQLTDELLRQSILPRLGNDVLDALMDAGVVEPFWQDRPALTLDSYVVSPWRFPGGDIGYLGVCGTVNDLAVSGATPIGLALGLIITEGFAQDDLDEVLESIARAAALADVRIITGDTKVVGHAQGDGVYITTAGLGRKPLGVNLAPRRVCPGDVLVINGAIGEHGLAVMLEREMPEVLSVLRSDATPLNKLIAEAMHELGDELIFMRDPTRSGVAGVAADLARDSGAHIVLDEAGIPVRPEARHAAEMLGLDPLEVANEGKCVFVVRPGAADRLVRLLQSADLPGTSKDAAVIGEVTGEADGLCELHTHIGGRRVVQKPYGEQLPRIC